MKYLLVFLGVMLLAWHLRARRRRELQVHRAEQQSPALPAIVEMVSCNYCGVHLPASESFAGQRGNYCTEEHRNLTER